MNHFWYYWNTLFKIQLIFLYTIQETLSLGTVLKDGYRENYYDLLIVKADTRMKKLNTHHFDMNTNKYLWVVALFSFIEEEGLIAANLLR